LPPLSLLPSVRRVQEFVMTLTQNINGLKTQQNELQANGALIPFEQGDKHDTR